MDSVVDLSLSSEDSDLSVPHVQPLLPLACKTILHVNAAEQQALTIFFTSFVENNVRIVAKGWGTIARL